MKTAKAWTLLALFLLFGVIGCRSHVIKVTVTNASNQTLSNIIVDYPGATFGIASLAPDKTFPYAIKPYETGFIKIQFTNAQGAIQTYTGTKVSKGDEGSIEIQLTQVATIVRPILPRH
jgi:hypothetical protein